MARVYPIVSFARGEIGQQLDVPDSLPQFIESGPAAPEQRACVARRLDSASAAIEKLDA